MEYKEAYKIEGSGGAGEFGLKVLVSFSREINENDKRMLYRKIDEIETELMAETIRLDPKTIERVEKDRQDILALFPQPIYFEAILNGYGPTDYWYRNFPWYQVTTSKGRIKIGWRKRVLNIDWSDSQIKAKAEELFPGEEVTKIDKTIHAWDYEKAKQYIETLLRS